MTKKIIKREKKNKKANINNHKIWPTKINQDGLTINKNANRNPNQNPNHNPNQAQGNAEDNNQGQNPPPHNPFLPMLL